MKIFSRNMKLVTCVMTADWNVLGTPRSDGDVINNVPEGLAKMLQAKGKLSIGKPKPKAKPE